MNKFLRTIGAIVFSIAMYAIPILLTCSFIYQWGIAVLLIWFAAMQMVCIGCWAYDKAKEGE